MLMDFLTSLALILLSSVLLGSIFRSIKLPPLLGMLLVGILLGPHLLNLIASPILGGDGNAEYLAYFTREGEDRVTDATIEETVRKGR